MVRQSYCNMKYHNTKKNIFIIVSYRLMSSCGTRIVLQHKIPHHKKICSSSFIYYRLMISCGTNIVLQHKIPQLIKYYFYNCLFIIVQQLLVVRKSYHNKKYHTTKNNIFIIVYLLSFNDFSWYENRTTT